MVSYLGDKHWNEISRTELLFTSHLYEMVRKDIKKFVRFLNGKEGFKLNERLEWEVSFEVAFYRDFLVSQGKYQSYKNGYSPKRTFDLCLFSEEDIVIIEAKAQQRFTSGDTDMFKKNKVLVKKIIEEVISKDININVYIVALATTKYFNNMGIYGNRDFFDVIDKRITWDEINQLYENDLRCSIDKNIFKRAESIYKK